MDSGGGLSGGPVLAGNRNFSKKFLSKKGSGSDGQKKIDYQYHNVLIGLWNSGEYEIADNDEKELESDLIKLMKKFVENKEKEIDLKKQEIDVLIRWKGKEEKSFVERANKITQALERV